jgi:tripartite-type tricarboxylate transporter receptor subunit TctC
VTLKSILVGVFLAIGVATGAGAQPFPALVVRVIVPFPPGGGIDVLMRVVAAELTAKWGQAVIIENRAGAGSTIGADAVAKAAPDGHTLLATANQTFTANRFLYKTLPYDAERGFVPITLLAQSDQFVLAHPAFPANDLRELVALDLLHVPYKGIAPLITATIAGEVMLSTGSAGVAGELLKAGRLKALAIAGKRRAGQFPNVPTTAEQGHPYLLATIWYGLFAPAATPAAVVEKIGDEVRALLKTPAFAEKHVLSKGLEVVASTPEELAAVIRDETLSVGEMIRAAGVQAE